MFDRQSVIIKDPEKLSFDYVPEKLIGREPQMKQLELLFAPVVESGRSDNAFISGNIGSGKTSTVKRFLLDAKDYSLKNNLPLDFIFVNCRQNGTESAVLFKCITHFDPGFPDRGFSPNEMLRTLRTHIEKRKIRLIIVLDEVNILFNRGAGDLIYQLSRFSEEFINKSSSLSLILISQENVMDRLDKASLSSFRKANSIRFTQYTYNQLKDIVQSRAELALVTEGIAQDAIELIADRATGDGDARFAIDLLDKAARVAETKSDGIVTADDVREVSDMVFSTVSIGKLEELGKNELLALLSVARAIKKESSIPLTKAEKTYAVVCEEYEVEPRKHTQYCGYIRNLINMNLLVEPMEFTSGKNKFVALPDIPYKDLCRMIEEILEKNL